MSVSGDTHNGAEGAFSHGYKGLHEVVTEMVRRYERTQATITRSRIACRFYYLKFCFFILQKHDLKSFFKPTRLI